MSYKVVLRCVLVTTPLLLAGCATWSYSESTPTATTAVQASAKAPASIKIITGDAPDRRYTVLGHITATVNKTTLFHPDPSKELVDQELREEAAKLGADAVINVKYDGPHVSLLSWGAMDGEGEAIVFTK